MQCHRCGNETASVHVSFGSGSERHAFCEKCAQEFINSSSDPSMVGLGWALYGMRTEGFAHMHCRVLRIEQEWVVVRVLQSSHYDPGSELMIRGEMLPGTEWKVGLEFRFTCSPAEMKALTGS